MTLANTDSNHFLLSISVFSISRPTTRSDITPDIGLSRQVFVFYGSHGSSLSGWWSSQSSRGMTAERLARVIPTYRDTSSDLHPLRLPSSSACSARCEVQGGTRGANVRTTCVGGSVLLSFTLAKSQSRPTPTASHPSHPSRSLWQPPSPPRSSTLPGFARFPLFVSLFLRRSFSLSHPLLSSFLLLFFSSLKRVCASTRFIAALHAPPFRFSATNNNVRDNFFRDIVGFIPRAE